MVLSCLVEPLVSPLIGRGTSGPERRSTLERSRLVSTALACTAILALSTTASLRRTLDTSMEAEGSSRASVEVATRNAHKKPDPIPYRVLLTTVFETPRREERTVIGEAPRFDQGALDRHQLSHKRDIVRDPSPGLGLGLRIDRLYGGLEKTYLRFGSGQHLSGLPTV